MASIKISNNGNGPSGCKPIRYRYRWRRRNGLWFCIFEVDRSGKETWSEQVPGESGPWVDRTGPPSQLEAETVRDRVQELQDRNEPPPEGYEDVLEHAAADWVGYGPFPGCVTAAIGKLRQSLVGSDVDPLCDLTAESHEYARSLRRDLERLRDDLIRRLLEVDAFVRQNTELSPDAAA